MDLPNEILLSIFALLERKGLKSSNLVSKIWRECASTILFDQIYVSSVKEDLEVFEAIAEHPLLSRCVRHIKYDATEFLQPLTKHQYITELRDEGPLIHCDEDRSPWRTDDHEVNDWVNSRILGNMNAAELSARFQDSQLIKRGYQSYREHATFQQAELKSGRFPRRLTRGLRKFKHLEEVTLEGSWKYVPGVNQLSGAGERCTGSYTARHWNRFYCKPRGWRWGNVLRYWNEDPELWKISPDGTQSYKIITTALVQAQCHILSFTVGSNNGCLCPGLPPTAFDLSGLTARQKKKASSVGVTAFANLEKFVLLRLASYSEHGAEGGRTPEKFYNIEGLPLILASMNRLKHLELHLSTDISETPSYYSEVQALPRDKIWPHLESLTLTNLSITASGLLHLLLYRTPNILHLEIGGISLLEGSWQAFFEALSQSQHLASFKFEPDTYLVHHDGKEFWTDDYESIPYKDLEEYVIHGGRHPCLLDHEPDSAAHEWLQKFDPTMRNRIVRSGMLDL